MRFFTLYTVAIVILGATACTSVDNEASATVVIPSDCRGQSVSIAPDAAANPTSEVLAALTRAQQLDARCGPPDDRIRICRAMFVVATLDPALHLEDPPLRQQLGGALAWAIGDARSVAPDDLVVSLDALLKATGVLTRATDDRSLLDALYNRAQPATTDPLDDYWLVNCR